MSAPSAASAISAMQEVLGLSHEEMQPLLRYMEPALRALPPEFLNLSGLGDDPTFALLLAKTPRVQYQKALHGRKHPANVPGHPQHETAREEFEQLRTRVYGGR